MSGHTKWQYIHPTELPVQHRDNIEAFVSGYKLALEDIKADLEEALLQGASSIDDALREVEVTLIAISRTEQQIKDLN